MELNYSRSRIGKEIVPEEQYVFSFKSSSKSKALLLPDPAAQYQPLPSHSENYSKTRHSGVNSVITKMVKLGKTMDILAQGIREHVRLGPKLSETVKAKLSLGARILQFGGVEKVFKQKFGIGGEDEKLLKASQCYLSTTAGPIAGLLFISSNRVGFCSERTIKVSSPTGKFIKVHYKVMIPLRKIERAIDSENAKKRTEKCVKIVTDDNFEFWFMGFLNLQRTLECFQQAIRQAR